jgi:hypothetical protein
MGHHWWLVVVGLVWAGGLRAADAPADYAQVNRLKAQVEQLTAAGKAAEAIVVCEAFLKAHPNEPPYSGAVVEVARGVWGKHYTQRDARLALCRRILAAYEGIPAYYAAAAGQVAVDLLWAPDFAQRRPDEVDKLLATALEKVGAKLPSDSGALFALYTSRLAALTQLKQPAAGLALAREAALRTPRILSAERYWGSVYSLVKLQNDADALLGAAKLGYLLCDYAAKDLKAAVEQASAALTAKGGPGPGLAFGRAQDDLKVANPLRDPAIKLPDLGERDKLLAAAGKDSEALLNVYLLGGEVAPALKLAKQQMLASAGGDQKKLATALRNIARCFKAHDWSLARANRFLEFHRTGEGQDPLPELEAELAAAKP